METIEAYIRRQSLRSQDMFALLRSLIHDTGHVTEHMRHGTPWFDHHGPLCSVTCHVHQLTLAFARGDELSDDAHILEAKERKHTRSVELYSIAEIEEREDEIRQLLNEAAIANAYHEKMRKK